MPSAVGRLGARPSAVVWRDAKRTFKATLDRATSPNGTPFQPLCLIPLREDRALMERRVVVGQMSCADDPLSPFRAVFLTSTSTGRYASGLDRPRRVISYFMTLFTKS